MMRRTPGLRVLHLAPLWFPVSPDAPGGIEIYLPALLGALEESGCWNTLIASGDFRHVSHIVNPNPRQCATPMGVCAPDQRRPSWQCGSMSCAGSIDRSTLFTVHRAACPRAKSWWGSWQAGVIAGYIVETGRF